MDNFKPVAIVTGAASGIGRAIAIELAKRNYELTLVDVDRPGAEQTCELCSGPTRLVIGDVSQECCWTELLADLDERGVQLLVNAAGVLLVGPLVESSVADLRRVVEVNLLGAMLGCRFVTPCLESHSQVSLPTGLINIASIFAVVCPPNFAAYNASKGGLVALSETLRHELAPSGHHVTAVLPGVVKTALFENAAYAGQEPSEAPGLKKVITQYAAGAELSPERVAAEAIQAFSRRRAQVTVGRKAGVYHWGARLMPRLVRRLVSRKAASEFGLPQPEDRPKKGLAGDSP